MKFKTFTKLTAPVFLVLVVLGLFAFPILAQDNDDVSGLSISPVTFELNADPGDSVVNKVKVSNPTDDPMSVVIKMEDFSPVGEEGQVVLSEPGENDTFSLAAWTVVTPSQFTIEPKGQQTVAFSVNVPEGAEPGGHYGSIVASISGATQQTTGSAVANERGSLVLMRVSGEIEEALVIDTFTTENFREYGPVDFDLKFENVGNVHVKPQGFVTITNFTGDEVAQLEIPQNNVIPGAKRIADVEWDQKNLIGRYTATLVANYGTGNKEVVTDSITFTVFPWKVALGILAIVIVIIVVLFMMRGRLKNAGKALAGAQPDNGNDDKMNKTDQSQK